MALEMSGEYVLPVPRKTVWDALNDAEMLKRCIPGCETLEKKSDTEFSAVVVIKLGPVKARFRGNVRLEDLDPPNSYRISRSMSLVRCMPMSAGIAPVPCVYHHWRTCEESTPQLCSLTHSTA